MDMKELREHLRRKKSFRKAEYDGQWDIGFLASLELQRSRAQSGLTQEYLAKKTGTKQPAIARAERGYISSLTFLNKCAKAMGMKIELRFVKVPSFAETERGHNE